MERSSNGICGPWLRIPASGRKKLRTFPLFQDMDGMLRSRARAEVVRTLADQDVKIHIYGEGWQYLDCKQENLIIHDRIPFDETIPLMADARIVLNVMPWFKSGGLYLHRFLRFYHVCSVCLQRTVLYEICKLIRPVFPGLSVPGVLKKVLFCRKKTCAIRSVCFRIWTGC